MKGENTKQKILETALTLFSERGYDAVSVGEIAEAVGIKARSLYNHYPSKQAIFDAIVETTALQYEKDTGRIDIHVQRAAADIPMLMTIGEEELFEKVRQIFDYSLHNDNIRKFRKMMTIEQFRSLIAAGVIYGGDTNALALMYVAPVITLIGVCDRQPERETECLEKLKSHVKQFYSMVHIPAGNAR